MAALRVTRRTFLILGVIGGIVAGYYTYALLQYLIQAAAPATVTSVQLGQAFDLLFAFVLVPGVLALWLASGILIRLAIERIEGQDDWCPVCEGYLDRGFLEEHMRQEHPGSPLD